MYEEEVILKDIELELNRKGISTEFNNDSRNHMPFPSIIDGLNVRAVCCVIYIMNSSLYCSIVGAQVRSTKYPLADPNSIQNIIDLVTKNV